MIRPDRVALLADVQIDIAAPPSAWRHNDGRPLAETEQQLVLGATIGEMRAAINYGELAIARYREHAAAIERAELLAAPYVAVLGPEAGVAEVLAAMPPGPERDEFARLAETIAFADLEDPSKDHPDDGTSGNGR
ncbi:hypothetical protein [Streptomyces phaeochromogenes]